MQKRSDFEWDSVKDILNQKKHGVSFALAQLAFLDQTRVILEDLEPVMMKSDVIALARLPVEL